MTDMTGEVIEIQKTSCQVLNDGAVRLAIDGPASPEAGAFTNRQTLKG